MSSEGNGVTVRDFDIPFGRLVAIILKVMIASIPALIVFYAICGLWLGNSVLGYEMHWLHVAGINMLICISVMTLSGIHKPLEQPFHQTYSKDVDVQPWKHASLVGGGVCVTVLLMYVWLHSLSQ